MTSTQARPVIPRPPAGPVYLPEPDDVSLTSEAEVTAYLDALEQARRQQLDVLPAFDLDPATAAYRDTIERILREVGAARERVASGRYGLCTACRAEIPVERLQRRPWVPMCTPCTRRASS